MGTEEEGLREFGESDFPLPDEMPRQEVPPAPPNKNWWVVPGAILAVIILLGIIGAIVGNTKHDSNVASTAATSTSTSEESTTTEATTTSTVALATATTVPETTTTVPATTTTVASTATSTATTATTVAKVTNRQMTIQAEWSPEPA